MFTRGTAFLVMVFDLDGILLHIRIYKEPHPDLWPGTGYTPFCINAMPADPAMHPIPFELAAKQLQDWALLKLPPILLHAYEKQEWTVPASGKTPAAAPEQEPAPGWQAGPGQAGLPRAGFGAASPNIGPNAVGAGLGRVAPSARRSRKGGRK